MTLDDAANVSIDRNLSLDEVQALISSSEGSPNDSLDALSIEIARRYINDRMSFEVADSLMNSLFAYTVQSENRILGLMFSVYVAFDEGEYYHREDGREVDPEQKYTRPQIALILRNTHEPGKRMECARGARPTRKGDAPLVAAQAGRWAS